MKRESEKKERGSSSDELAGDEGDGARLGGREGMLCLLGVNNIAEVLCCGRGHRGHRGSERSLLNFVVLAQAETQMAQDSRR